MKHLALSTLCVLGAALGNAQAADAPFTLAVVPSRSSGEMMSIEIGGGNARPFYTVLTNVSQKGQEVYQTWNSWGYYNVEFEAKMPDGKKLQIKRGIRAWTRNFPSTFLIPSGERYLMEFPWSAFEPWEVTPAWPKNGEYEVSLKAVYKVENDLNVWAGRVESPEYKMKVRFAPAWAEKAKLEGEKKAELKVGKGGPDAESGKPGPQTSK